MDQNTSAVLLSISVYALYVLLPLIPSVIIYKMFPETKVTAEGSISNWKIKSGGAFAAYVVVVLLGHFIIDQTQDIIGGMSACTWTIHGQVLLKDKDNQPVPGNTLLQTLDVTLKPDLITKQNQVVDIRIPSQGVDLPSTILNFSIPRFGDQTIDLQNKNPDFEIDRRRRRIDFKQIVIKEFPQPLPAETPSTDLTAKYQAPLTAPGPSPLAIATP
jgi:hypothetical protein